MKRKTSPYLDPTMAEYYAVASAPYQFDRPARGLVSWLKIDNGEKVLDIGSGTGMVAAAALDAVGSVGWIVAIDSSIEMLRRQQRKDRLAIAAASASNLPFADGMFDRAVAGFVITHFPDYGRAFVEIVRVLRPGGILGASAWGGGTARVSEIWRSTIGEFVDTKTIDEEFRRTIPWDEFFSDPANLIHAFEGAGFTDVKTHAQDFSVSTDIQQYVAAKIGSIEGTIVRNGLKGKDWSQMLERLSANLKIHFPDGGIAYSRSVHFVAGKKQS